MARFLQLDFEKKIPGSAAASGRFDDIMIRLLVAPPGILLNNALLTQNEKIGLLKSQLQERISVFYPKSDGRRYDDYFREEIKRLKESVQDPDEAHDWEHVILVYFSGHGFSKRMGSYFELNFVTPHADKELSIGSVNLDAIMEQLGTIRHARVFIADACRSEIRQNDTGSIDPVIAHMQFFRSFADGLGWQFFFSSNVGHYSYEQADYGIEDFVSKFQLWPKSAGKGNGVFTLGFLASLLCGEGGIESVFTLESSKRFMTNYFFKDKNKKWEVLRKKLETELAGRNLPFVVPDPYHNKFEFGNYVALRSNAMNIPLCFQ